MNAVRTLLVSIALAATVTGGAVVASPGESAGAPAKVNMTGEHLCC